MLLTTFAALMATSCRKGQSAYDPLGSDGLTARTENLRTNLLAYEDRGVIMGQMYGTTEGIGWQGDSARSDIHEVSEDWPACIGFELAGIERGSRCNADGIAFSLIHRDAVAQLRRQGLVVMTWAAPDPGADPLNSDAEGGKHLAAWTLRLADYLSALKNDYGIKVPVVLALYPLGTGRWYDRLPADDYRALYTKTIGALRDAGLTNAIFAYANSATTATAEEFMARCPEEGIDVVQYDCLDTDSVAYGRRLSAMTRMLSPYCASVMKTFGVRTGLEGLGGDPAFWTRHIVPVVESCRLSYILLGRNHGEARDGHFSAPFPGNNSVTDFMTLYNHPRTFFMSKLNGLLIDHNKEHSDK